MSGWFASAVVCVYSDSTKNNRTWSIRDTNSKIHQSFCQFIPAVAFTVWSDCVSCRIAQAQASRYSCGQPLFSRCKMVRGRLPKPSALTNLKLLRAGLRKLDKTIPHSFRKNDDTWKSIPAPMLRRYYRERRLHMIGEKKSRRWAKKHGGRVLDEASPDKAVFTFWHTDVEEGHSTFLQLPWVALVGLQSMVRNGGFQAVYLLCFHRFENVPDGVKVMLLDNKTDFDMALHAMSVQWGNRRGIAALSDILRLRACQASPHSMNIVCDVDTLFLSSADPRTFLGHWFGTHAQNPTSLENFNAPQRRAKLLVEYCKDPEDMLKAVCPFGFPSKSKMLAALLNYLEEVLAGIVSGVGIVPRAYDFPMQAVARFVMEHGLREAYLPATVFSSLPYYAWGKPLLASSLCQRQWGIKVLQALPLELAPIAVNAFWQSTNTEDGPVKRWDPKCVESGSTWSVLMELAGIPNVHTGNVVECIADAVHDLAPNVWLPRTLPRLRMSTKGKESRFYHEIILNCSLTILFVFYVVWTALRSLQ